MSMKTTDYCIIRKCYPGSNYVVFYFSFFITGPGHAACKSRAPRLWPEFLHPRGHNRRHCIYGTGTGTVRK